MFIDFSPLNISHRWLKKWIHECFPVTCVFQVTSYVVCFPVRREFENPRCPISKKMLFCIALSQRKMRYAFFQLRKTPKKRWPPPVVISRVPRNPFEGDEVQELSTKAVEIKDIESENHLIHSRHPCAVSNKIQYVHILWYCCMFILTILLFNHIFITNISFEYRKSTIQWQDCEEADLDIDGLERKKTLGNTEDQTHLNVGCGGGYRVYNLHLYTEHQVKKHPSRCLPHPENNWLKLWSFGSCCSIGYN